MASWLAGAGLAGSAIGSLFSAQGAALSGQAQSQADLYQAGIANLNASLARQNAAWASMTGEQNASIAGLQGRSQEGQIIAGQGASNLDVNSGTQKLVQQGQTFATQTNETTIRGNAAQQAYAYRVQAEGDTLQAGLDMSASSYAQQGASINVASSLLGGASSVATKWLQASQMGALPSAGSIGLGGS